MSAQEFIEWQAFLRRHPVGFRWENWALARLLQMIDSTKPRKKGERVPRLKSYLWSPPEPLIVTRKRAEAKAKARKAASIKRKGAPDE